MIGSNVHYFYYTAEHCFRSLAKAGIGKLELYLGTPHVFIDGNVRQEFDDLEALSRRYGVEVVSVHPETLSFRYTLCHPDPSWNERSVRAYRSAIEYAAGKGIPRLNTNIAGGFRDRDREETFEQIRRNLLTIGKTAEEKGVRIGIEAESPYYQGTIRNIGEVDRLLSALPEEVFDVAVNMDALEASGETLEAWFKAFGDRIRLVRFGDPKQLPAIREACRKAGFRGEYQFYPLDDESLAAPEETDARAAVLFSRKEAPGDEDQ